MHYIMLIDLLNVCCYDNAVRICELIQFEYVTADQ